MAQPSQDPQISPAPGVATRLLLAWLALTWERLWIRLWLPAAFVILFAAAVLADIPAALPAWLQAGVVVIAIGAILYFISVRLRGFAIPTRTEARARLESSSPVTHRPLTTVEDSVPAGASAVQQAVWFLHQSRARAELARLRATPPAPGVARKDRFGLRVVAILLLFVAVIGGSGSLTSRFWRNIVPSFGHAGAAVGIKLWITPPVYTGRSPVYVELPAPSGRAAPSHLDIAQGSTALVVVTGTTKDVELAMDNATVSLDHLADASLHGQLDLKPARRIELRQGSYALAGWDVTWIPDTVPTVAFTTPPLEGPRWRLRIDYKAADDYGVQDVTAHIVRADDPSTKPEAIDIPLAIPPFAPKQVTQSAMTDLTAHPWAGMKVKLTLKATDQAGQVGASETVTTTLPERVFTHPVSQEIARQRKALLADAKAGADPAQKSLAQILAKPEAFAADPLVDLALSGAKFRLGDEPPADAVKTVPDLMWYAAVRIEDGNLNVAEQRLAEAEKALREAVEKGANTEEVNQLIDKLQQALADFSKSKTEKQDNAFASNAKTPQDIAKMMKQLRQMSQMGAKDYEKQQLAELEKELEDLRDEDDPGRDNKDVQEAQRLIAEMENVTRDQADQLNKNFERARQQEARNEQRRSAQENHPNQRGDDSSQQQGAQAAASQEDLRRQLADIMQRMQKATGKDQQGLSDAQDAMSLARDDFRAGSWQGGIDAQGQALSRLQNSSDQAREDLMESLFEKGLGGLAEMPGSPEFHVGQGSRSGHAAANNDNVEVPTGPDAEGMSSRVRAILDEIRARASDRTRSADEQDYLKRLMKQF